MKTSITLLPGVLIVSLISGCSNEPAVSDLKPAPAQASYEVSLDAIIKPGAQLPVTPPATVLASASTAPATTRPTRTGSQEFGLSPIANEKGEVDLKALTSALQTFVADRMVPANSIKDLHVLVDEKFLPSLPAPPPGQKYVWDNRLNVTLASLN